VAPGLTPVVNAEGVTRFSNAIGFSPTAGLIDTNASLLIARSFEKVKVFNTLPYSKGDARKASE
jgi:hypothetical protein